MQRVNTKPSIYNLQYFSTCLPGLYTISFMVLSAVQLPNFCSWSVWYTWDTLSLPSTSLPHASSLFNKLPMKAFPQLSFGIGDNMCAIIIPYTFLSQQHLNSQKSNTFHFIKRDINFTFVWWIFGIFATTHKSEIITTKQHFYVTYSAIIEV